MDAFESDVAPSMTKEEFARAVGCTPESAPFYWGTMYYLDSDKPEDQYCMLPDPFSPKTKPEALNRWLEWTVPFLGGYGISVRQWPEGWFPDTMDLAMMILLRNHIDPIIDTITSPGEASIAACVAVLNAKKEG